MDERAAIAALERRLAQLERQHRRLKVVAGLACALAGAPYVLGTGPLGAAQERMVESEVVRASEIQFNSRNAANAFRLRLNDAGDLEFFSGRAQQPAARLAMLESGGCLRTYTEKGALAVQLAANGINVMKPDGSAAFYAYGHNGEVSGERFVAWDRSDPGLSRIVGEFGHTGLGDGLYVRNRQQQVAASMSVNPQDATGLFRIYNDRSVNVVEIGTLAEAAGNSGVLQLRDARNRVTVSAGTDKTGHGGAVLVIADGQHNGAQLSVDHFGGHLLLSDRSGRRRAQLGARENGGRLELWSGEDQVRFSAP